MIGRRHPTDKMSFRGFRSFALVAALLCALLAPGWLSPRQAAQADVGELPEPGGLVSPGDKTDQIRMKSEKVVFSVRPNDGTFRDLMAECYAHVTADFVMQNLTARPVTMTLFFPLHSTWDPATFESAVRFGDSQIRNVRVLVDGREAALTFQTLVAFGEQQLLPAVFEATFPAVEDTPIHVEYDLRGVYEPKSPFVSFRYSMQTGSHWAGTIGSGQVIFEFSQPVDNKSPFGYMSDFLQVAGGRLEWDFADLEPDASHDITVTFEPAALVNWAKRPAYLQEVAAGRPPPVVAWSGRVWPLAGALGDLPDASRPERGWIMQLGQDPGAEWIELILDRPHTVMGLRIRTGIPTWVEAYDPSESRTAYDLYRRPKTVAITLSGALTQTVALADTPAEWHVVALPNSPTDHIRLTFLDSYPGLEEHEAHLGVGHIELLGVDAGDAEAGQCSGPNLLRNGDFEQGFGLEGTGLGWQGFSSAEGAAYTFCADPWPPAVYQGRYSQLVAISSYGITPMADRWAGISQGVDGLEPGAVYELSLAGMLREEAAHPGEDACRYTVQWALAKGRADWRQVAAWQALPWNTYYPRTEPGPFSTQKTRLLAPDESATLFLRAWKKWATLNRELDVSLDAISLRRCGPLPTCKVWDLAQDLRRFPDQENPNRDSYGNQAVWQFMQGVAGLRDPSEYGLLPSFTSHAFGIEGLEQWTALEPELGTESDNLLPAVGINATDATQTYSTLSWPAHTVRVHPADNPVIVGWQSPITGQVRISGLVRDMDAHCGNGVSWSISLGRWTLVAGELGNGEAQSFAEGQGGTRLDSLLVSPGELLHFVVDPHGEAGCDSTQLDIRIESAGCRAGAP